jgi:hypothetical protein
LRPPDPAAGRVRDERDGAYAQNLRDREHHEREVAGGTHARDGLRPEVRDEIQVDDVVEVCPAMPMSMTVAFSGYARDRALVESLHEPASFRAPS